MGGGIFKPGRRGEAGTGKKGKRSGLKAWGGGAGGGGLEGGLGREKGGATWGFGGRGNAEGRPGNRVGEGAETGDVVWALRGVGPRWGDPKRGAPLCVGGKREGERGDWGPRAHLRERRRGPGGK